MTTENLALFQALGAKMDYLNQKQRVIAQNIANSDTPDYRPQTLKQIDFGSVLKSVDKKSGSTIRLETTNAGHMPPPNHIAAAKEGNQKTVYETTPDGNSVVMEEQLINSQKNQMDYNLMTSLYQKQVGMIKIALGKK